MTTPQSTYRLQITSGFTLDDAASQVDYLARLGVDWVYLSPLLKAEDGSDHGYDVVDFSVVDPARGGPGALARLADTARRAGRGVLVDIVPNHTGVATPAHNPWWWDLLTHGRDSHYAEAFDVDWDFGGGRVRVPVLGDATGDDELDRLELVDGELRYYDHRFPVAPGTADDGAPATVVHDRQHYELVNWRRADAELNYRRFFAVNTLAGVRVEVPWVFDESHAEIIRWVHDGLVQGLRVDHPDGLADPGGYLDALRAETGAEYIVVEKILEGREALPDGWQTEGTSGYDALADFDRVLVDPAGQHPLDELETALQAEAGNANTSWEERVHAGKRSIADGILRSEVLRIARLVPRLGDPDTTADALAELLAAFPVYRSYLPLGSEHLRTAARRAAERRPNLTDRIDALLVVLADPAHPAAVRFQQTSGMVMAKGVEDTAYYRYSRLTSLNEVGADPAEFAIGTDEFHRRQQARLESFPASMTTLSTHDTKRGEDVRARIAVLAEVPAEWRATLARLRELAPLGDAPFENLLWQAIVGAWPASRERLAGYALKAAREAGLSTTWTAPNQAFETALGRLVDSAFDDTQVAQTIDAFVARVRPFGWSNSLSAKLLQLTAPGVPDVYQGSELWETSLVDPDNRRPIDYAARRELLTAIDDGWLPQVDEGGAAKLLVTSRALRLRRDRADLFTGYRPLQADGAAADHVVAFGHADSGAITVATRRPAGLAAGGGWRDTAVDTGLDATGLTDVLTGIRYDQRALPLRMLLGHYPVALLVPDGGETRGETHVR
ncbi:malto-oligosyltrehalose synthase [Glaciibacter sp. 2TAF33]|uniref:malto-oligosyltrehalose synthase n=1 Tax=Glaciibacter sp. 2TAF33 TaxID=3233015 RepID=UPI003F939415